MTNPASSPVPGFPDPDTMGDVALLLQRTDIPTNPMNQVPRITGQRMLVDKEGRPVGGGKHAATLALEVEQVPSAAAKNAAAMTEALGDLDSTGGIVMLAGGGHFVDGFVTSSRIMLKGEGWNAPITFQPTVPGTKFFMAQRRRYDSEGVQIDPNPSANSEKQLESVGLEDIVLLGNRQTRCHGVELRGVDHAYIRNVQTFGIAGTGLNLQHVREYQINGYYGRYNGYCDPDDPTDMDPGFVWGGSVYAPFESSNLSTFHGVQEAFTFGTPMLINGAIKNSIIGGLLHMLAPSNTSLEDVIIQLFGGARGWDGSGNPRNMLAALLSGAPNVATVSGRKMRRGFAACSSLVVKGASNGTQLDQVNIVGSSGLHLVRVDGGSDLVIGQGSVTASASAKFSVTADQATGIFTINSAISGNIAQCPETGETAEVSALTAYPYPIVNAMRTYVIRLSDTTFKLAATYADAIAGTAINLTAAGSGLEIIFGGQMLYATDNSEIAVDPLTKFDDGYTIGRADGTSAITSEKVAGTVFGAGPALPATAGERLLFSADELTLSQAATDYTLRKRFRGARCVPTRVEVIRRSGGPTTAPVGNIQVYTAASAGGTALLNTALSITGLDALNKVVSADTKAVGGAWQSSTATPLYVRTDTPSGQSYLRFDVRVYGRCID